MRLPCALLFITLAAAESRAQAVPEPKAQAKQPEPPQVIEPPRLAQNAEAAYPQGATGGARVVFEIDIDEAGAVANARLITPPQPGFDESALEAARRLRFAPASQGGKPVPVRIQFAFNFAPPRARPAAPPPEAEVNLAGQVRERGTRRKVVGAEVSGGGASALTDAEGRFELRGLPHGEVEIAVTAPGHEPLRVRERIQKGQRAEVLYRIQASFQSPLEAVIEGERPRKELSRTALSTAETERIPGAQGDAIKVVEDLPGVARTSPIGGGLLVIRGSKPGDSLVFLDGQYIPLIWHFGALSSTVNPDLLEGIDLLPGNFSVYYGDMTGGLVDVRSRKLRDEFHGYANVSLLDTSALIEGPVAEGLTFAVAGRRSYFDLILKQAFKGSDVGLSVAPRYYDAQLRLDWRPKGSGHALQLLALTSSDRLGLLFSRPLDQDPNVSGSFEILTAFSQVRLKHGYRSGAFQLDVVGMFERLELKLEIGAQYFTLLARDFFLRSTAIRELSESLSLSAGVDLANRRAIVGARFSSAFNIREGEFNQNAPPRPDASLLDFSTSVFTRFSPGAWAEGRWRPLPSLSITAGLRLDAWKYTSYPDPRLTLSPRLALRWEASPALALKGGTGLYTEGSRNGDSAREFGNPAVLPERAWQTTIGIEARPLPGVYASFETFYKALDRVISRTAATELVNGQIEPVRLDNAGVGRIYGIEVLVRRELTERFFGWLAYSLSRSERQDRPGQPTRLFDFDQTHALTLIASYKLPRGWQIGARFRLISGNPETPVVGARYLATFDVYLPIFGAANSTRLPLFHQLDVRIDKVWTFDAWTLDAYLDVVNAYNRRAVEGTIYSYDYSQRDAFRGLPILPSLGLKGSF